MISPCWLIVDREGDEYLEITPSVKDIIDISFGTRSALGVQEVSNSQGDGTPSANDGMCSFYPEEPIVTITVN